MNFLLALAKTIGAMNTIIGRAVSWLLPLMTVITLIIIFCAFVLRAGWVWLNELALYMHAILFMLAAAYTLNQNAHVRVDILYNRLTITGRAWVNLIGTLVLLMPVCGVIVYYSTPYIISSWEVTEHSSESDGLPAVFLLKTCIPLAALLLWLEGLALAINSLNTIIQRR